MAHASARQTPHSQMVQAIQYETANDKTLCNRLRRDAFDRRDKANKALDSLF